MLATASSLGKFPSRHQGQKEVVNFLIRGGSGQRARRHHGGAVAYEMYVLYSFF